MIPGVSLVPADDDSVLFASAGIQPLVPYVTGAEHPAGRRLADIQRCLRTVDNPHLSAQRTEILDALEGEERAFHRTLRRGVREVRRLADRGGRIDGGVLFGLFETYGMPPELSLEELRTLGVEVPDRRERFDARRRAHRDRSRRAAGLAG